MTSPFVKFTNELKLSTQLEKAYQCPFYAIGNHDLFYQSKTLILNSRYYGQITGDLDWLKESQRLIVELNSSIFLVSLNPSQWDFIFYLVMAYKRPFIYFQCLSRKNYKNEISKILTIIKDFGYEDSDFLFIYNLLDGSPKLIAKESGTFRDRFMTEQADILYPVNLAKGGNLHSIYEKTIQDAKPGKILYPPIFLKKQPSKIPSKNNYTFDESVRHLLTTHSLSLKDYVIHWTKGEKAFWPGESFKDYFTRIFRYPDENTRSALFRLIKIVKDGLIRCSERLIPGKESCVSFSKAPLDHFPDLMTYRKGMHRWNLEPYAVAIRLSALQRVYHCVETSYLEENISFDLDKELASATQNSSWKEEKEIRVYKDVDLSKISSAHIKLIVFSTKDQGLLCKEIGHQFEIVSLS